MVIDDNDERNIRFFWGDSIRGNIIKSCDERGKEGE